MKKILRIYLSILLITFLLENTSSLNALAAEETVETTPAQSETIQDESEIPGTENAEPEFSLPETSEADTSQSQSSQPEIEQPEAEQPPVTDTSAANDSLSNTAAEEFTVTDLSGTYYVISEGALNVRSGPSQEYDILTVLKSGQEITVTGITDNDWYQIQYAPNQTGFVSAKFISDTPVTSTSANNTTNNEAPAENEAPVQAETETIEETLTANNETSASFINTPVMFFLIIAIIIVIILIGFSVYGLFHHGNPAANEDDNYDDYANDDYDNYDGDSHEMYGDNDDNYDDDSIELYRDDDILDEDEYDE